LEERKEEAEKILKDMCILPNRKYALWKAYMSAVQQQAKAREIAKWQKNSSMAGF
jgi:uncharacterized protein YcaQ